MTKPKSGAGKAIADFMSMINIETDECIVWQRAKTASGYGNIAYGGRNYGTHRLALELRVGSPPNPGMHAAHGPCGNKLCINYRHLRWATVRDNAGDTVRDGTRLFGERNPQSKLTLADVADIRRSPAGFSARLADVFGVSKRHIRTIRSGDLWRDAA